MFNKYLDWDKWTFGDMIDPRRGFIYQTGDVPRGGSRYFFDASAGFVGYSKHFFFGGAVHHLNRPDETMIIGSSRLPMRFTGHMGAEIKLGGKSQYRNTTSIMPNVIYQYQNGFQELAIGTYFVQSSLIRFFKMLALHFIARAPSNYFQITRRIPQC